MVRRRRFRRYSPRRYAKRFRRGKAPISLLTAIPIGYKALAEPLMGSSNHTGAVPMLQGGANPIDAAKEFANIVSINFTGYDFKENTFIMSRPLTTYGMILAGYAGHMIASKLGVNRQFRKIPMVGKWVSL